MILFAPGPSRSGLLRVSSAGGAPTVATTLDQSAGEDAHRWPHFLPDGRHFFYTADHGTLLSCQRQPSVIRIGIARPAGRRRHPASGRVVGVIRLRPS